MYNIQHVWWNNIAHKGSNNKGNSQGFWFRNFSKFFTVAQRIFQYARHTTFFFSLLLCFLCISPYRLRPQFFQIVSRFLIYRDYNSRSNRVGSVQKKNMIDDTSHFVIDKFRSASIPLHFLPTSPVPCFKRTLFYSPRSSSPPVDNKPRKVTTRVFIFTHILSYTHFRPFQVD